MVVVVRRRETKTERRQERVRHPRPGPSIIITDLSFLPLQPPLVRLADAASGSCCYCWCPDVKSSCDPGVQISCLICQLL